MPRTKESNQRLREVQRTKILEGARKVFASKGLNGTMADVAAAAEVSQGLAYRYFTNKEAIFKELVKDAVQFILSVLKGILEMPGTPLDRLEVLIFRILETRRESRQLYHLSLLLNDEATPDDLRELVRKQGQAYKDVLRQLIIEGQAKGEVVQDDPEKLVLILTSCINGLSKYALRYPEQYEKHFPDARVILRMLKA